MAEERDLPSLPPTGGDYLHPTISVQIRGHRLEALVKGIGDQVSLPGARLCRAAQIFIPNHLMFPRLEQNARPAMPQRQHNIHIPIAVHIHRMAVDGATSNRAAA